MIKTLALFALFGALGLLFGVALGWLVKFGL